MLKKRIAALAICFILISTFGSVFVSASNNDVSTSIDGVVETSTDIAMVTDTETDTDANLETPTDENNASSFFDKVVKFIESVWNFVVWLFSYISLFAN